MAYDPNDPFLGIPQIGVGDIPGGEQVPLYEPPSFNDSTEVVGTGPSDYPVYGPNEPWPVYGPNLPDTPNVGGGGGGNSFLDSLKKIFGDKGKIDPKKLAAIALMAQQLFGKNGSSVNDVLKQNPSLDALMKLQTSQATRQDPLHKAVTQLATNLLPNSAFGAGPNRPLIG